MFTLMMLLAPFMVLAGCFLVALLVVTVRPYRVPAETATPITVTYRTVAVRTPAPIPVALTPTWLAPIRIADPYYLLRS